MYVNVIENLNIGQYVKECIYGVRLDWLVYSLCPNKHIVCGVFVSRLPYTVVLNFFTTSKPNPEHRLRADFRVQIQTSKRYGKRKPANACFDKTEKCSFLCDNSFHTEWN